MSPMLACVHKRKHKRLSAQQEGEWHIHSRGEPLRPGWQKCSNNMVADFEVPTGFEPAIGILSPNGFADRRVKPFRHSTLIYEQLSIRVWLLCRGVEPQKLRCLLVPRGLYETVTNIVTSSVLVPHTRQQQQSGACHRSRLVELLRGSADPSPALQDQGKVPNLELSVTP